MSRAMIIGFIVKNLDTLVDPCNPLFQAQRRRPRKKQLPKEVR